MKKTIVQLALMLGLVVFASALLSPDIAVGKSEPSGIKLKIDKFVKIERVLPEVKFVPGESEVNKKLREQAEAASSQARELVARERPAQNEQIADSSMSLEQLRELYRSASSKFGIDPRLLEAVHQVETGKSTTCKRNASGATGPMQFMPSTFRAYSSGDICNVYDAVDAAANLLSAGGASSGDIDSALFNYNHSTSYVNLVKSVMYSI